MPDVRINLKSTSGATLAIPVPPGATKLSASIKHSASLTWGNAVVALEWSAEIGLNAEGTNLEDWQAFSPAVTLITGTRSKRAIGITGASWVRFHVTTVGTAADPNAMLTYRFY